MRNTLTIRAPEGVVFEYELAGIGSRTLAYAVDFLLRAGIPLLVIVVCTVLHVDLVGLFSHPLIASLVVAGVYGVFLGYYVLFETFGRGQTPGKRLCRLRVVCANGVPVDFYGSLIRNVLRVIDHLPLAYTTGILVMFANARAQRIGDLVADTIVIKEQHTGLYRVRQLGYGIAEPAAQPARITGTPAMTSAEYEVLHDYLTRRQDLVREARQQIGRALYERLVPAQPPAIQEQLRSLGATPGRVLEELARAYRRAQYSGREHPPQRKPEAEVHVGSQHV